MPASASASASGSPPRPRQLALRLAAAVPLLGAVAASALGTVTITFSSTLVGELQLLPGQGLPAPCIQHGIATYSGASLVAGTSPVVNTACLRHLAASSGQAAVGAQPLMVVAALLVASALAALAWRWRGWRVVAAAAPLAAALLVLLEWALFAGIFEGHFRPRVSAGAVAAVPATGLWTACGLLLLAALVSPLAGAAGWARRALAPLEAPRSAHRR